MKIRKAILTTLILLIVLTISACNKSKIETEPAEIHIMVPFVIEDQINSKVYQDAVVNFEKLNPLIKVKLDYATPQPNEESYSLDPIKLLESSEPPDIVQLSASQPILADKKGLLIDLLPLMQANGSKGISIPQQILDTAVINGKLLQIPYAVYPNVVYYNKEIFDQAKISYPQGDWTWEQFREISKKLKTTYGSILSYDSDTLDILMGSMGKGVISSDGKTTVGYLDSPEVVQTIQWLNAYYRDDDQKKAPMTYIDAFEQFDRNKTAGMVIKAGDVLSNSANKDTMGIAPLPHFEGSNRANQIGLSGFGISQKSKHPEAAWKFIEYLTLVKNVDSIKFAEGFLTTSKSIADASGQSSDPIKSILVDEMNYATKSWVNINPYFGKAWNKALNAEFAELLTTDDSQIQLRLHELALKLDLELTRLKDVDDLT
ncbi:extracellular solute-binding protein [Paenibacillus psychroresistens]|uniref:Extracellular solute-binding protein n=1 Tax=Paenibacillus psychroresistens TaxID=1778678 RepID=A0A6B8RH52_9BACL|nr:extracellular solute-binding protein [Paenibacillus psychroresistens]QGQ95520.1 extracellular solute-binding protein [Paenibacillus psychroresistens]